MKAKLGQKGRDKLGRCKGRGKIFHVRSRIIARDGKPEDIDKGCYEIWEQRHQQHEFSKLCRAPRTLQIFAAI